MVRQRRDDAIPDREPFASRLHAVSVLTDDQTLLTNSRVQRAMTARIHDVEAGRDDTDDEAAGVECADVGRGVDPDRESAHDGDARAGQEPAELARVG